MKRALKSKLKELGYKFNNWNYNWVKNDIQLNIINDKIVDYCVRVGYFIENEEDLQELKDYIASYEKQLKIMQKDLEELGNVESER